MGRTINSKEIRCWVENKSYEELKQKSKELGLNLNHYAGLVLSGYQIAKKV